MINKYTFCYERYCHDSYLDVKDQLRINYSLSDTHQRKTDDKKT